MNREPDYGRYLVSGCEAEETRKQKVDDIASEIYGDCLDYPSQMIDHLDADERYELLADLLAAIESGDMAGATASRNAWASIIADRRAEQIYWDEAGERRR